MLRADLEADARAERRLSSSAKPMLSPSIGVVLCGSQEPGVHHGSMTDMELLRQKGSEFRWLLIVYR